MAMQLSVRVRSAIAQAYETDVGASPIIDFYDAVQTPDCAAAPAGNLIARGTLPADWATVSNGVLTKSGTWQATGVLSGGTARGFRIYRSGSPSECDLQGTVGPTGSPTYDMGVDNVSVANGQVITVNTFTVTIGNA